MADKLNSPSDRVVLADLPEQTRKLLAVLDVARSPEKCSFSASKSRP